MSHLRLVAGTDVTGPARNRARARPKRVAKPEVDTKTLEAQARVIICGLKPGLEGKSVEALIAEKCRILDGDFEIKAVQRCSRIGFTLRAIGIHPHAALPDEEVDVAAYGIVIDPTKLLKACPALKPYAQVLEGLTL
ncbi:hypothetical protein [Ralstonia sp. GX3-BWBA]|uniref:hypothetical protein n=1 Tax=Ralstonia sp. GX3-BWBA TaxID=2219865 RepID=UPI0013A6EB8E|nr:hypothetical protein [Ralstonia sp. GX3-BWBA]